MPTIGVCRGSALTSGKKKQLKDRLYIRIAVVLALSVAVVLVTIFGAELALSTNFPPVLTVLSESMSISQDSNSGWVSTFDRTLHIGDLVVIQGVQPDALNTNYPNSDIIVYHQPDAPDHLVVHRIVSSITIEDTQYFFTKGDGTSENLWPDSPETYECDHWVSGSLMVPSGAVSQDLVVGKVVMRVPWLGYIAVFLHDTCGVSHSSMVFVVAALLVVLISLAELAVSRVKWTATCSTK